MFDTTIILDACRYDYYVKYRKAEKVNAPGTITRTSIPKMFPDFYSAVYISASPEVNSIGYPTMPSYDPREHFLEVIDVWNFGWDDDLQTVHPGTVHETAEKYQKRGDKTIVHFMQPHAPYIGEFKWAILSWYNARARTLGQETNPTYNTPNDFEYLKKAYDANLRLVLGYAEKCINGRTLITSDHGELLGEEIDGKRRWGHLSPSDHPKLLEVPREVID